MSYALARKFRPKNFGELVGQKHISQALAYALDKKEIHHAYLFTGTRGVGKTTIARIFAKSLNCEQGISSKPCGKCSNCLEIDAGVFPDLIEIDAASRSQVESTRQFLSNVPYKPVKGRFKVYLIDEVHMFSDGSFNALLKTLEEPPEHIKFILATTDPQKIPQTVISRCLQFQLKNMTEKQISEHLKKVLEEEGVKFEEESLDFIAEAAQGSMRDALSILDQARSYGLGEVKTADCAFLLGAVPSIKIKAILAALVKGDGETLRKEFVSLEEYSPDYSDLLRKIIKALQEITIAQLNAQRFKGEISEDLVQIASTVPKELVQIWYEIAQDAWQSIAYQTDSALAMEMTLLRMLAFKPVFIKAKDLKSIPAPKEEEKIKAEEIREEVKEENLPPTVIEEAKEEKNQVIEEVKAELGQKKEDERVENLNLPWNEEPIPPLREEDLSSDLTDISDDEYEDEIYEEEEKKKITKEEAVENLLVFIKKALENKDIVLWHDLIAALPKQGKADLKDILASNFFPLEFEDNLLRLAADDYGDINRGKVSEIREFLASFLKEIKVEIVKGGDDFQSYFLFLENKKAEEQRNLINNFSKHPKNRLLEENLGIRLNKESVRKVKE